MRVSRYQAKRRITCSPICICACPLPHTSHSVVSLKAAAPRQQQAVMCRPTVQVTATVAPVRRCRTQPALAGTPLPARRTSSVPLPAGCIAHRYLRAGNAPGCAGSARMHRHCGSDLLAGVLACAKPLGLSWVSASRSPITESLARTLAMSPIAGIVHMSTAPPPPSSRVPE